jgi:hypothetical protein
MSLVLGPSVVGAWLVCTVFDCEHWFRRLCRKHRKVYSNLVDVPRFVFEDLSIGSESKTTARSAESHWARRMIWLRERWKVWKNQNQCLLNWKTLPRGQLLMVILCPLVPKPPETPHYPNTLKCFCLFAEFRTRVIDRPAETIDGTLGP